MTRFVFGIEWVLRLYIYYWLYLVHCFYHYQVNFPLLFVFPCFEQTVMAASLLPVFSDHLDSFLVKKICCCKQNTSN